MVRFGDKIWRISSRAINKIPIPRGRSFSNAVEKTSSLGEFERKKSFRTSVLGNFNFVYFISKGRRFSFQKEHS